jgi:BirA family biotin operon repressor/biotin-[acetyl-CoA-carboxylase] ligase
MNPVLRYVRVGSTQDVARDLARGGAAHGTTVLAEVQEAGRGRLDRRWESGEGLDLAFSVVLRPGGRLREAPLLTLGAAAALADTFDVRVKWPNDVVDGDGRKLAGILAEAETAEGDRVAWVVLGVGLNVNRTAFPGLPNATSLALLAGGVLDREDTFQRARSALLAGVEAPDRLDRWRARAHTLGRHVRVAGVEGVAEALRDDGALMVGGVAVTTGEIGL